MVASLNSVLWTFLRLYCNLMLLPNLPPSFSHDHTCINHKVEIWGELDGMNHTLMIFITFDVPQLSMSQMPTVPSGSRCPTLLEKEAASSDGAKGQIIPFSRETGTGRAKFI